MSHGADAADQHPGTPSAEPGGDQARTQSHVMGTVRRATDPRITRAAARIDQRRREVDVDDVAATVSGGGTGVAESPLRSARTRTFVAVPQLPAPTRPGASL